MFSGTIAPEWPARSTAGGVGRGSGGGNAATVSLLTGRPFGTNYPAGEGPYDRHDHSSTGWALRLRLQMHSTVSSCHVRR